MKKLLPLLLILITLSSFSQIPPYYNDVNLNQSGPALNDELAAVTEVTAESAALARGTFEDEWNTLNLLRTLAVVAGFACLVASTSVRDLDARPE